MEGGFLNGKDHGLNFQIYAEKVLICLFQHGKCIAKHVFDANFEEIMDEKMDPKGILDEFCIQYFTADPDPDDEDGESEMDEDDDFEDRRLVA